MHRHLSGAAADHSRFIFVLLVLLAAVLTVTTTSVVRVAGPAFAAGETASSAGMLSLRWTDAAATPELVSGGGFGYVVLNAWQHDRIAAIRAASPGVKVLVYKEASATVGYAASGGVDNALLPAGVGYHWAQANAPSWFLRDASGAAVEWADFRNVWPMDVGNPGYQQKWVDNVTAEALRYGWDGVMLDDTLTYLSHPTVNNAVSTQIPTDQAMATAMGSFLSTVGPGLRAAGLLAVPNVTLTWQNASTVLRDWAPSVSGWLLEYYVKWGSTSDYPRMTGADWLSRIQLVETAQSTGRFALPVTYGSATDTSLQTYHRASWLLAWDGRAGASIYTPQETSATHWLPAAATDIGQPTNARYTVAGGTVWRRDYTEGTTLLNPTSTTRTITLDLPYTDATGATVTTVTLAPATATILRRSR